MTSMDYYLQIRLIPRMNREGNLSYSYTSGEVFDICLALILDLMSSSVNGFLFYSY